MLVEFVFGCTKSEATTGPHTMFPISPQETIFANSVSLQ